MKLTEAQRSLLEVLSDVMCIYARPKKSTERDQLFRAGLIESYTPTLKVLTGRAKCWRITPAGRAALEGGRDE